MARRPHDHRPTAGRREVSQIPRNERPCGGLNRDLQEHRVIPVGRCRTGPRKRGNVCLKLEDGLNRGLPDGRYAKFGPRENLAIFGLDAVVDRDPEMPAEQRIHEAPGRPEW